MLLHLVVLVATAGCLSRFSHHALVAWGVCLPLSISGFVPRSRYRQRPPRCAPCSSPVMPVHALRLPSHARYASARTATSLHLSSPVPLPRARTQQLAAVLPSARTGRAVPSRTTSALFPSCSGVACLSNRVPAGSFFIVRSLTLFLIIVYRLNPSSRRLPITVLQGMNLTI